MVDQVYARSFSKGDSGGHRAGGGGMTLFRSLQILIAALLLVGSAWLIQATENPSSRATVSRGRLALSEMLLAGVVAADNGTDNGGDNGGGGDNNAGDNGGNNNSNSNGNGNGNSNDSFDNDNFDVFIPPPPSAPSKPAEPACANPGQETAFNSADGKVTVRVFPSFPSPIKIQILQVIDFLSAPLPPGNLVGLLAYEIRAGDCNGGPNMDTLPGEVNLAVRYNALEAAGLNKSRIVIGRLDPASNTWVTLEKLGNDPANNFTSATISQTGFYMVYEAR